MTAEQIWVGVGLTGQLLFGGRWVVQWLVSEREGRSIVPKIFWYLSLVGGLIVLSYAIYRKDPVFILGQWGVIIYLRNIFLIYREERVPQA